MSRRTARTRPSIWATLAVPTLAFLAGVFVASPTAARTTTPPAQVSPAATAQCVPAGWADYRGDLDAWVDADGLILAFAAEEDSLPFCAGAQP